MEANVMNIWKNVRARHDIATTAKIFIKAPRTLQECVYQTKSFENNLRKHQQLYMDNNQFRFLEPVLSSKPKNEFEKTSFF